VDKGKPGYYKKGVKVPEFELSGMAWVQNGMRLVFNARKVIRGRQKGMFEIYYRKGYNYKKDYVKEIKCLTKTQS